MSEIKFNVETINTQTGAILATDWCNQSFETGKKVVDRLNKEFKLNSVTLYALMTPVKQEPEKVPFKELPFEVQLIEGIKQNMMNNLSKMDFIMPEYSNRIKVPADYYKKAWELVDHEKVMQNIAIRIEQELADRIMNNIAQEMATDIKQLLGDKDCDTVDCVDVDRSDGRDVFFKHPEGLVYIPELKGAGRRSKFHCFDDGVLLVEQPLGFLKCPKCEKTFLPTQDSAGRQSMTEAS